LFDGFDRGYDQFTFIGCGAVLDNHGGSASSVQCFDDGATNQFSVSTCWLGHRCAANIARDGGGSSGENDGFTSTIAATYSEK
jgi:hypothetical protein